MELPDEYQSLSAEGKIALAKAKARHVSPTDPWWYLSFADDPGFLGACIVQAQDQLAAVSVAHNLRINPGGQVLMLPMNDTLLAEYPMADRNRLLTAQELRLHGAKSHGEWEAANGR
jgi:hypothetical protein